LTKQEKGYFLAADSAVFLDRHSPTYVGSAIEFLLTPRLRQSHAHLTEAVRRGGTALGEGMLDPENSDWVKNAHGMMPMARLESRRRFCGELIFPRSNSARKSLVIA
jgi:hypothetical protein